MPASVPVLPLLLLFATFCRERSCEDDRTLATLVLCPLNGFQLETSYVYRLIAVATLNFLATMKCKNQRSSSQLVSV